MSKGYHSELAPSSAERWTQCPGSRAMVRGYPDDPCDAAEEGTDTHEFAAVCLTLDMEAAQLLGKVLPLGYVVDETRAEHVQGYLDYTRSLPGEQFVEEWLSLEEYTNEPGGGGTADHLAVDVGQRTLYVTDLKYGWVPVQVLGNKQLRTYALGALRRVLARGLQIDKVVMSIYQPRVYGEAQVDEITAAELITWGEEVLKPAARATEDPDAPRIAGVTGCMWCQAKGKCPELAEYAATTTGAQALTQYRGMFTPPAPGALTDEQVGLVMGRAALVGKWLEAVDKEGLARMQQGVYIPGQKMVRGKRGNRKWNAPEDAIVGVLRGNYALATETIYSLELLSPAKMLALPAVKENPDLLLPFIVQAEGAVCAAPASDKRPAISPELSAETVFNDY